MELYHETLTFQRSFLVPAARLFEAFRNPREREVWSAPDDNTAIEIVECDFRTGGREKGLCGSKGNMNWSMNVTYHLVESDRLITFTEELREGDRMLTIALITVDITPTGDGCTLNLTDQITSFVGQGGVSGHRDGYSRALNNLGACSHQLGAKVIAWHALPGSFSGANRSIADPLHTALEASLNPFRKERPASYCL